MPRRPPDRRKGKRQDPEVTAVDVAAERRRRERRMDERVAVQLWVDHERGKRFVGRRVVDLSARGVRLDHGLPYPVGTRTTMKFRLPGDLRAFSVKAEVVASRWHQGGAHTSLRFLSLSPDDELRIHAYIERCAVE